MRVQAAELFVLYAATLLGREVASPAESFAGLAESERNAWEAVANAMNGAVPEEVQVSAEFNVSSVQP